MLRLEGDGLAQGVDPLVHALAGDAEDEIEVDIVKSRIAQDGMAAEGLVLGMHAAQSLQQAGVPALHAHADTVDAQFAQARGFFQRDGGGVHLDGELLETGEIHALTEAGDEVVELRGRERGGGASAKENGARLEPVAPDFRLAEHRIEEGAGLIPITCLLVKTAIRTHLRTEWNVRVEMFDHG